MQRHVVSALVKLALSLALPSTVVAIVGCNDAASTTGGGGQGGGGSVSSSSVGSDASTSIGTTSSATTASTSTATATSSSSSMATPCIALKDGVAPNPTPGVCQGDVAVTCGQDGFLTQEACTGGSTCATYDLQEWEFNASPTDPKWVKARTVGWAGCKPPGTQSCTMTFDGNTYQPGTQPACNGTSKVYCQNPPAPDLFSSSPQLQYGSTDGWLVTTACGPSERCAGSDTFGVLTCIDASTPSCDGTEPFCSAQGIVECQGTWESQLGYRVTQPCPNNDVCRQGTSGPFCTDPSEVPCDVATFGPERCEADQGSRVSCYQGWTSHQSCAMCLDDQNQTVPCRCDTTDRLNGGSNWGLSGLVCDRSLAVECVPQASTNCDPTVDADTCVGNVAHRCLGQWHDLDCGASGLVCGVSDGLAGCRAATAMACDINYQNHCSGTEMVGCCACNRAQILFGPPTVPCVPGFETTSDCADLGANYSCKPPTWPFQNLECVFTP